MGCTLYCGRGEDDWWYQVCHSFVEKLYDDPIPVEWLMDSTK